MKVTVDRRGGGVQTLVYIDGVAYRMGDAAAKLGLSREALQKRIERGNSLVSPRAKHGSWPKELHSYPRIVASRA